MNKEMQYLQRLLLEYCYSNGIIKKNYEEKKIESILDGLTLAVLKADISSDDLEKFIKDVNRDEAFNLEFFERGGNLFRDYIKTAWVTFAKCLLKQKSGLGTPNAAAGEGELMFLFLSRKIKKPTRGDLQIGDKIIELKGECARVYGDVSGIEFRKRTIQICRKYNLNPNKSFKNNFDAVEIEKIQHINHWRRELSRLSITKQKEFISQWLSCLDLKKHEKSVCNIFSSGLFDHSTFVKEIVKILYAVTSENGGFDKFVMLGNCEKAKVVKSTEDFNRKIDAGEIVPDGDYFRINQGFNIGWYIS